MYVHQMTQVCKIVLYRSICICIIQICVKSRSGDYPYTGVAPADFAAQSVAGLARGSLCPVFSPPTNNKRGQEKTFASFPRGLASVQSFPNLLCFMPWLKWKKIVWIKWPSAVPEKGRTDWIRWFTGTLTTATPRRGQATHARRNTQDAGSLTPSTTLTRPR